MPSNPAKDYWKLLNSILPEKDLSEYFCNQAQNIHEHHNASDKLEGLFKNLAGGNEVVSSSPASSVLYFLLLALGVKTSDLVVLSSLVNLETISAVIQTGAIPILMDISSNSCSMDGIRSNTALHDIEASVKLAQKWLPRRGYQQIGPLKAVIRSYFSTNPEEITPNYHQHGNVPLINVRGENWLNIINNNEKSPSSSFDLYSFSPGRGFPNMGCGMLVTSDKIVADHVRLLRNLGCQEGEESPRQLIPGFTGKVGSIQADIWSLCLTHLDEVTRQYKQVTDWYEERLSQIPDIQPSMWSMDDRPFPGGFSILISDPASRNEILQELDVLGVVASAHPIPVHLHPYMMEKYGYRLMDCPNAESLCAKGIILPFSHRMTERQVDYICRMVKQILD
jgi:dTDP-4-amino-4,6-dideoxygalactose transaminase